MDFLTEQIRQMEEKLVGFKALDLPSQTIHGGAYGLSWFDAIRTASRPFVPALAHVQ